MVYHGGPLDPAPESVSVWNWLFEGQCRDSRHGPPIAQCRNGLRDGESGDHLSFRDLSRQATACAAGLRARHGVQPQQTIAVLARNAISYHVAVFAAARLGAVVAVLPPTALADDIVYYLEASGACLVLYDGATASELAMSGWRGGPRISMETGVGALIEGADGTLQDTIAEGARLSAPPAWTPPAGQSNKNICAILAFSSGTTGKPKAVMISHCNVIAQLMQVRKLVPDRSGPMLGILPFYHITGIVHLLHLPVMMDQELVLMPQFDMKSMLDAVVKYRCEELWMVPPLLIRLVSDKIVGSYNLDFVRQFDTGAAPLPPQVIEKLEAQYPNVALRQAWGMTESCSCLTVTPPGLATYANAPTVGKVVPGTEMKIVDVESGKELELGQIGELWARGPQITMGYRNNEAETRKTYTADGFLRTGDLGTVRPDGFVVIHDRIKEMIKVRGHGVAPAELEDALLGHPKVVDAAVIGVPHHYSGEVPKAYVVPHHTVTAPHTELVDELHEHIAQRKPRFMRLTGGVVFVDAIPKSAAGKILRKVLRARHAEEAAKEPSKAKL